MTDLSKHTYGGLEIVLERALEMISYAPIARTRAVWAQAIDEVKAEIARRDAFEVYEGFVDADLD